MNQKRRFIIYGIVAIFLAVTYFIKEFDKDSVLPLKGTVPEFSFTDSHNETISKNEMIGKVWVADFIFTTCNMACPVMTGNMNLVHKAFRENDDVRIVSISVYPEYDTPEVLTEYAARYNANTDRWHFLTGSEELVQDIIKNGFKIGDYEDIIFHSEKFALVDQQGQIRGYYNGMKTEEITQLKTDIKKLLSQS